MERLTGNDNKFFQDGMDEHKVSAVYFKLKAYEDAEEQGLLVRLPCKVGDAITATVLRPYNGHSAKIHGEVSDIQFVVRVDYDSGRHIDFLAKDFGKTFFLTHYEAEKVLEEANRNG